MRTIGFLIQKEFLQIFRNRGMLRIIIAMPVVQLLVLSNAATFTIKNVTMVSIDKDQSVLSHRLVNKFPATGYFILENAAFSEATAEADMRRNDARMILQIPEHFERDASNGVPTKVQLTVNAEDGSAAGLIQSYSASILADFVREIHPAQTGAAPSIQIESSYWYNPELNYVTYMIPGIIVALVTMIGLFLTGMNIVREKEMGTIEQLNVTPIRKRDFIIGKLLPFWLLGLVELTLGLLVARLVFHLPMVGSLLLIYAMTGLYLLAVLGMGLLVSTMTDTQQQAMFIAWFFMVVFLLLGGVFTPIDSMPHWAQVVTRFDPVAHFVAFMRQVLLKGAGWGDVGTTWFALSAFAVITLGGAILRYRKTTG